MIHIKMQWHRIIIIIIINWHQTPLGSIESLHHYSCTNTRNKALHTQKVLIEQMILLLILNWIELHFFQRYANIFIHPIVAAPGMMVQQICPSSSTNHQHCILYCICIAQSSYTTTYQRAMELLQTRARNRQFLCTTLYVLHIHMFTITPLINTKSLTK